MWWQGHVAGGAWPACCAVKASRCRPRAPQIAGWHTTPGWTPAMEGVACTSSLISLAQPRRPLAGRRQQQQLVRAAPGVLQQRGGRLACRASLGPGE